MKANLNASTTLICRTLLMYNRLIPDQDGMVGDGVRFERIRRITGYLVGTLDRFNDGKKAEVLERVKHQTDTPATNR